MASTKTDQSNTEEVLWKLAGNVPVAEGARCWECPLYGQPHADSKGLVSSKVVFVGEAPGREEVYANAPFVGRSGKLLTDIVAEVEVRHPIYKTNACLCRPENNTTPSMKAIQACRPRLVKELQQLPRLRKVFLLGLTASKAVLGTKESLATLRRELSRQISFLDNAK